MDWLAARGVEYPIIQAPMAGVQGAELAAAVSNAGGLGSLPCAMLSEEALERELTTLRQLTSRALNLNFFCHQTPSLNERANRQWLETLEPYFDEWGIDPASLPTGPQRQPFSFAIAQLIAPFKPEVVSFHFGLPEPELLKFVKSRGSFILSSATTLAEARWLEAHGVDAIIAQGLEAGGHRGHFLKTDLSEQLPVRELLPAIRAAVSLPVIAAGGIARPDQVAQLLGEGASAVQVGSAYLLADEANTGALHRAALGSDRVQQTALTNLYTGRPARGMLTRLMKELGPMKDSVPAFPLAANAVSALRAAAEKQDVDAFTPLWCGEGANPRAESAASITRYLASALKK